MMIKLHCNRQLWLVVDHLICLYRHIGMYTCPNQVPRNREHQNIVLRIVRLFLVYQMILKNSISDIKCNWKSLCIMYCKVKFWMHPPPLPSFSYSILSTSCSVRTLEPGPGMFTDSADGVIQGLHLYSDI